MSRLSSGERATFCNALAISGIEKASSVAILRNLPAMTLSPSDTTLSGMVKQRRARGPRRGTFLHVALHYAVRVETESRAESALPERGSSQSPSAWAYGGRN